MGSLFVSPDDKEYMLQEHILLISSKSLLSLELAGNIFLEMSRVINANPKALLFVSSEVPAFGYCTFSTQKLVFLSLAQCQGLPS